MGDAFLNARLRFACTSCGACCNRSPEVELSEAAPLADRFVFRLMFRLYELPRSGAGADYYESKRLLAAFAGRKYAAKARHGDGRPVETMRYLMVSALSLDTGTGACGALSEGRCTIYDRRPLACRTVPLHYSRPEAGAEQVLAAFVATPGHDCDTGKDAPVLLEGGRIVDPLLRTARAEAVALAGDDQAWREAIVRRLKTGSAEASLPSLGEIEANAAVGAMTTSMRVAWQIAAEAGLIEAAECRRLIESQVALIDRELAVPGRPADARETLAEMRSEYRAALGATD